MTLLVLGSTNRPAQASHAGGMDAMSIDLDTTDNTATSLGVRDECVEVSAGDTVTLDITASNVPDTNPMVGFGYTLNYNDSAGRLSVESVDHNFLLAENTGSSIVNASQQVPDTDGSGTWGGSAADIGASPGEFGDGVLSRLTISIDSSTPAGPYPLNLTAAAHIDSNNEPLAPDTVNGASIAVDTLCTGPSEADIEVSAVTVSSPGSVIVGDEVTVAASATLHNLGPAEPADVDLTLTLNIPPDCNTDDPLQTTVPNISLDASVSVVAPAPDHEWAVSCDTASNHVFAVSASATIDGTLPVDINQDNNSNSGQSGTIFLAESDVSLSDVSVTIPPLTYVATAFDVGVSATLHNLGPNGPANTELTFTLSIPPECRIMGDQEDTQAFTNISLPVSTQVAAPEGGATFVVQCDEPGLGKTISVSATAQLKELHVTDPVSGNASGDAQDTTDVKVGICGDDPDPSGDVLQNMSPVLLTLISDLTDDGTQAVPEGLDTPLDCQMTVRADDNDGAPIDDCEYNLLTPQPCSVQFDVGIDRPGGTPPSVPGPRLNPIPIFFVAPEYDFAGDLEIANGVDSGSANFFIRVDAGLGPNGTPCKADFTFFDTIGYEGGIEGNVPESNDSDDLTNPNVWPNDLNAERALVEESFDAGVGTGVTLHSRMIVPLTVGKTDLPLNVLVWRIHDLTFQTATGAGWVILGFPGDAVGPDPAGTIGGDPDADDPVPLDVVTCAPMTEMVSFNGTAGGALNVTCTAPGSHMSWALIDPDAVNYTQDEGPRSDVSTCSEDADGDGLTAEEEEHYGTDPLNPDTDGDTVQDGPDNCKLTPNPGQANFDGDDLGDACDPDIDGDGTDNPDDVCPQTTPGEAADSNGCSKAQVDKDGDDVCDPGAPSGGPAPCTGSDVCPSTAGGENVGPDGCSQAQVDQDADGICDPGAPAGGPEPCSGEDNCPTTANAGQEDLDSDGQGDVCDNDVDGDGVNDVDEENCGSDPMDNGNMPERVTPSGSDEDGDGQTDEGLPAGAEGYDCDGDGFKGWVEAHVFANAAADQIRCGLTAWPADFITGGIPESTEKLTIQDLTSFLAPDRRLDTSPGDEDFDVRWDLTPGAGLFLEEINIQDLTSLIAGNTGHPPMFGGVRAFAGPVCSG